MATRKKVEQEVGVDEKLKALAKLQMYLSDIDRIKTLRGELPHEVADLEDEIVGLGTRMNNLELELKNKADQVNIYREKIEVSKTKIERYTGQIDNVRNSKEYDHLTKELEYENLEIELAEKKIRDAQDESVRLEALVETSKQQLADRSADLEHKKEELDEIVSETKSQEEKLRDKAKKAEATIDPRLLAAFKRIRKNARNGLAVVPLQRGACGGCFNKIPPQKQMDVKLGKKVIVCEYCGRIMIDPEYLGLEG